MIKKKLVTFCGTSNNDFSNHYPPFDYTGDSSSEKSFISLTLPSYPENLVYYEHFNKSGSYLPWRLSFLLVGTDADLKVHNFGEYKHVGMIDFSKTQLDSVHSIFTIVSKIPSCKELQIHLCAKNLMQTKSDLENATDFQLDFPKCSSVTHVTFRLDGAVPPDENATEELYLATRIPEILNYIANCFPKLESVKINLPDQCQCPGWIKMLLEHEKLDLKKYHKMIIENGRAICEPIRKRPSHLLQSPRNAFSSSSASIPKEQCCVKPPTPKKDVAGIPTPPPTPDPDQTPSSNVLPQGRIRIKTENPEKVEEVIDGEEILPPQPEKVDGYDAVSDDELEPPSPLKKPKVESQTPARARVASLPTPPPSISTTLEARGSLRTIGKEYYDPKNNDWENSDDEEHENAIPLSPEVLRNVQFDKNLIQTALNQARSLKEFVPKDGSNKTQSLKEIVVDIDKDGPPRPQDFIEGVHYERRRPLHSSKPETKTRGSNY